MMHCRHMDSIQPIPNLAEQIEDVLARVERAGLHVERIKSQIEDAPPCLSTREGQALFRSQLQPWRVVLRNGRWSMLWAFGVCWACYALGRAMVGLGLREAWRLVRVR